MFRGVLELFFLYGDITDVSCISIFIRFLAYYAFQSIATFIRALSFILVFTILSMWPSRLKRKDR